MLNVYRDFRYLQGCDYEATVIFVVRNPENFWRTMEDNNCMFTADTAHLNYRYE